MPDYAELSKAEQGLGISVVLTVMLIYSECSFTLTAADLCYICVLLLVAAARRAEGGLHFSHRTNVSQERTEESSPNCLHGCG